jgi:hypothetical protein
MNYSLYKLLVIMEYLSKAIMFAFFVEVIRPWGFWIYIVLTIFLILISKWIESDLKKDE